MKVPVTLFLSEALLREVEEEALKQIRDAASIDADSVVFATPDMHTGYGVPIGSVLASPNYVSPSAVGYDVNCGMRLLATPFEAKNVDVRSLADEIGRRIPLGEGRENLSLSRKELELVLTRGLEGLGSVLPRFGLLEDSASIERLEDDARRTEDFGRLPGTPRGVPEQGLEPGTRQLGTLGGGNHFIEIQELADVEESSTARRLGLFSGQLLVMIHSGSRRLGYEVAGHHMRKARAYLKSRGIAPPNGQLLYFPTESPEGEEYHGAMNGAANYAFANREVMALLVRQAVAAVTGDASKVRSVYDVTHNMAKRESHGGRTYIVHRKGATRAFDRQRMKGSPYEDIGQPVLIPGSMGTASYVLVGYEGSSRSFYSVNHGAGRRMSRTEAAGGRGKKGGKRHPARISDREFERSMEGVFLICGNRRRIKEEAPEAYKDIDEVIRVVAGAGLAIKVARLRPLAVLKG